MIWFFVVIAVIGAALVATSNPWGAWAAQALWIVSNGGFMVHNLSAGDLAQASLFGVYLALSIVGALTWWRKL